MEIIHDYQIEGARIAAAIELDDGNLLKDFPILAIKEYEQQIPLSSHFIDKKKLGDRFDVDNLNYSIVQNILLI